MIKGTYVGSEYMIVIGKLEGRMHMGIAGVRGGGNNKIELRDI
jgi:hypothetical protein